MLPAKESGSECHTFSSVTTLTEATELFDEILKTGKSLRVKVTGQSMAPSIDTGDIVIIKALPPAGLKTGDLIFYRHESGHLVLHRLIRKIRRNEKLLFSTCGDRLPSPDTLVPAENILGRVVSVKKTGKGFWREMQGFPWQIINPVVGYWQLLRSMFYRLISLSKR